MKYTINTYGINGKFTAMQAFIPKPLLFNSEDEAIEYAKNQGENIELISVEEYKPEEWILETEQEE